MRLCHDGQRLSVVRQELATAPVLLIVRLQHEVGHWVEVLSRSHTLHITTFWVEILPQML
jgi:hypothetical protein